MRPDRRRGAENHHSPVLMEEEMEFTVDPLDQLFVDQAEVDRSKLASALLPLVRLDMNAKRSALLPGAREKLGNSGTVMVALLSRKVFALKDTAYLESAQPKVLEADTGIPGGTLRPLLQALLKKRLVVKNADGYVVPNWAIDHSLEELKNAII